MSDHHTTALDLLAKALVGQTIKTQVGPRIIKSVDSETVTMPGGSERMVMVWLDDQSGFGLVLNNLEFLEVTG